ncbi:hypothetical protein U9M48_032345 [Paspalum notatum var. saurae]|uniref:Uncharacterized protein n=1 Tax=Paspalum notatum var. saurae TaxID=547442 RepID=A0AAQ3U4X1_PASNO
MKPKAMPSRLGTQVLRVTNQQKAAQGVTKLIAQEQEREREEKKCSDSDLKFLQDSLEDLRIWKLKSGERCG